MRFYKNEGYLEDAGAVPIVASINTAFPCSLFKTLSNDIRAASFLC
jgi:hypothetical protein